MLIFNFNKSFSASAPPLVFGEAERIITAHRIDEVQAALGEIAAANREEAQSFHHRMVLVFGFVQHALIET